MGSDSHYSVLLKESVDLLGVRNAGIYLDGTFGRGGHSIAILNLLGRFGELIALDCDPSAVDYAKKCLIDPRFSIIHGNFADVDVYLRDVGALDGAILDLGVSSPQLDEAARGFSFSRDAKLDMRMDTSGGVGVDEWLLDVDEGVLADILWRYGEERFSRQIARKIVAYREKTPIVSTKQLAMIIEEAIPVKFRSKDKHPATKSFQAIRIFINNELKSLEIALEKLPGLLKIGGRLVIISFHSLEDRMVKSKFNELANLGKMPKWVALPDEAPKYKILAKKVKASGEELALNRRSRSAILRAIERLS